MAEHQNLNLWSCGSSVVWRGKKQSHILVETSWVRNDCWHFGVQFNSSNVMQLYQLPLVLSWLSRVGVLVFGGWRWMSAHSISWMQKLCGTPESGDLEFMRSFSTEMAFGWGLSTARLCQSFGRGKRQLCHLQLSFFSLSKHTCLSTDFPQRPDLDAT